MVNHGAKQRFHLAVEALNRADFPAAIDMLSDILGQDEQNAAAWRYLGVCYLETGKPDLALEALARAIRYDPNHATAHYLLGNTYGTLGHLERAAACYRHALELEPQHGKAEEFLIRAESLLESREHYRNGLRLLYSASPGPADLNQALRELAQSVAIFEGSPARDNLLECARKLLALKTEFVIAVDVTPGLERWSEACERGYQCVCFRNWIGAREAYEEALEYRVGDAFVHHALGFAFAELAEIGDCVRAWLRTIEIDPGYDFKCFGRLKQQPGSRHSARQAQ